MKIRIVKINGKYKIESKSWYELEWSDLDPFFHNKTYFDTVEEAKAYIRKCEGKEVTEVVWEN